MSTIQSMRRTIAGWTSTARVLCGFPIGGRPNLSFGLSGDSAVNRSSLPLSFQSPFVEVWE